MTTRVFGIVTEVRISGIDMKYIVMLCGLLGACAVETTDTDAGEPDVAVSENALTALGYPLPAACTGHVVYGGQFGAISQSVTDIYIDSVATVKAIRPPPDQLSKLSVIANRSPGTSGYGVVQTSPVADICVLLSFEISMPCSGVTNRNGTNTRWFKPRDGQRVDLTCFAGATAGPMTTTVRVWGTYSL